MLLITSIIDVVCPPESISDLVFLNSNGPTLYGNLIGVTYRTPTGNAGIMRKYITALCYTHLFDNHNANSVFYGNEASIYGDSQWIWNIPRCDLIITFSFKKFIYLSIFFHSFYVII